MANINWASVVRIGDQVRYKPYASEAMRLLEITSVEPDGVRGVLKSGPHANQTAFAFFDSIEAHFPKRSTRRKA